MPSNTGNKTFNRVNILLALLFAVGLAILLYPFVNNWFYQSEAQQKMDEYAQMVEQKAKDDPRANDEALAAAEAYNQRLVGQVVPDVFAIREGTVDEEYEGLLNPVGNLVMGTVEIPVIDVNLPIYHYSTEETLQKGCGHIFGSSLPVGGESSHTVITAHRGMPTAKMFSDLDQMRKGDVFLLHVQGETLAYEVYDIEVVKPDETRSLAIEEGKDRATLVTCTPYGVNTDRLLVHGERIPYEDKLAVADDFRPFGVLTKLAVAAAGVALALLALLIVNLVRKRRLQRALSDTAHEGIASPGPSDPVYDDAAGTGDDVPGAAEAEGELDYKIAKARHRA